MPNIAVSDERGRITLGREIVEKYGKRFAVVQVPKEIVLIPIPKDPLKTLREEGKKIPKHLSIRDLRKIAEEAAYEEVSKNLEMRSSKKRKR